MVTLTARIRFINNSNFEPIWKNYDFKFEKINIDNDYIDNDLYFMNEMIKQIKNINNELKFLIVNRFISNNIFNIEVLASENFIKILKRKEKISEFI